MNINDKQDVIKWLKRLKDDHPLSVDECRLQKSDGSMTSRKQKVFTDQVIKNRYQGMIDYLESDEVTSGRTAFDDPIDNDGNISIKWGRADVRGVADDNFADDNLTDDEVDSVLCYLKNKHDASLGVNWDTIDFWIGEVISERGSNESHLYKCECGIILDKNAEDGDICGVCGVAEDEREYTVVVAQETIEDTLREDTNERLLYCNTCGEGTPYKDMGLVYGQYCCISCADGMGEKLTSRGCIA